MMVNIAYALLGALKVAVKETRSASGDLKGPAVEKVIQELLHVSGTLSLRFVTDSCSYLSFCLIPTYETLQERH
jgi:hypothetical protein